LLAALEARWAQGSSLRGQFRTGYLFGLAFYLTGAYWIALLSDVAITVPWLKYPAWVTAALYLALFPALAVTLSGWVARRAGLGLTTVFPFAWLAVEELRASGELGFPWFQPGYSQHAYAPVIQLASLGSVTLITLWLCGVNVLLWRALRPWLPTRGSSSTDRGAWRIPALGAAFALLLPWLWGQRVLQTADAAAPAPRPAVALIQGNVPGELKWSGRHQREILQRFLQLSQQGADGSPRPSIILWPETATGSYLRRQVDQTIEVLRFASRTGIPVFSGFPDVRTGPQGEPVYQNAAGLFPTSGAPGGVYAKRHLVPFGERMPFQRWLPGLGRIELGQAEWTPGDSARLFPSAAGPFTCLICFESIFPDLSRNDVRRGARWLVNITNDEWFGDSPALYQHAAMARLRTVENHVPMARCANTGLTLIIDAYGRTQRRLPVWRAAVLNDTLPPVGPPTWYTKVGDWPGWVALAALIVPVVWRRRTPKSAS
jgi:apolipoprotein N-acyltransferase